MSAAKPFEESYAVARSSGRVYKHRDGSGWWWDGDVITRWGLVGISGDESYTRYDFVHRGRHWMRTENCPRTGRGIAIEATKFAKRIASVR